MRERKWGKYVNNWMEKGKHINYTGHIMDKLQNIFRKPSFKLQTLKYEKSYIDVVSRNKLKWWRKNLWKSIQRMWCVITSCGLRFSFALQYIQYIKRWSCLCCSVIPSVFTKKIYRSKGSFLYVTRAPCRLDSNGRSVSAFCCQCIVFTKLHFIRSTQSNSKLDWY